MKTLPFLDRREKINGQALNQFYYHVGIGRVETKVFFGDPVIFTRTGQKGRIYTYDPSLAKLTFFDSFEDFNSDLLIQAGRRVFARCHRHWCELTNLENKDVVKWIKAQPLINIAHGSRLINYRNQVIFHIENYFNEKQVCMRNWD